MAKKTKKYADGGETMSDVLSGNFPAARRFKEGYEQMPDMLKDPMLGLSVKAVRPKMSGSYGALEKMTPEQRAARQAVDARDAKKYAKKQTKEEIADQKSFDRMQQKFNADSMKKTQDKLFPTEKEMAERSVSNFLDDLAAERGGYKKGGAVKKMAKGGSTASKRADGIAVRGKTRGRNI
jgi:ribosomal protein L18